MKYQYVLADPLCLCAKGPWVCMLEGVHINEDRYIALDDPNRIDCLYLTAQRVQVMCL